MLRCIVPSYELYDKILNVFSFRAGVPGGGWGTPRVHTAPAQHNMQLVSNDTCFIHTKYLKKKN